MKFTYGKNEKIKSEKLIGQLFSDGKTVVVHPLRLVYKAANFTTSVKAQTSVSVSKRQFKSAVDRNYIKRLLREAYRLNKNNYLKTESGQYAFMILYQSSQKPTYNLIEEKMNLLFKNFNASIHKNKDHEKTP